jgi:hypothetical protein
MKKKILAVLTLVKANQEKYRDKPLSAMPFCYLLIQAGAFSAITYLLWSELLQPAWKEFFQVWRNHPLDKTGTALLFFLVLLTLAYFVSKLAATKHWAALIKKESPLSVRSSSSSNNRQTIDGHESPN